MTQTATQIINIIPTRISEDHYQISSFIREGKIYNQHLDYDLKRWTCDCPNYTIRKNLNCKHIILLRAYIQKAEQAPGPEQHSNSQELISILMRIANLENVVGSLETENHLVERDLEEHNYQLDTRAEQERALKLKLDQQAKQIDRQADLIGSLQTSVCRLNERTINQDETIKSLLAAMAEQKRMLEDQTQQIDHLHAAVSQQKPVEQVVRVVVEAAKQACQERQPAEEMNIKPVKDQSGKVIACKVNRFNVKVLGSCAAGCDCSIGIMDRQCGHMVKVDQFLSK